MTRDSQALLDFQAVMRQFLDAQRVMLHEYLESTARRRTAVAASAPPQREHDPHVEHEPPPAAVAAAIVAPQGERDATSAGAQAAGRFVTTLVDCPRGAKHAMLAPGHLVVVTDDGQGIARSVAEKLRREGQRVAIVAMSGRDDELTFVSPLDSPAEAERVLSRITELGPIAAIVHLAPLAPVPAFDTLDPEAAWERLCYETRSLFLLAQAAAGRLEQASRAGGAALVACTGMGGAFALQPAGGSIFPGQGAVAGLTKCLAIEWPSTRVRTVDLDPAEPCDRLAGHILDELWAADAEPEIGYRNGRRAAVRVEPAPADLDPGFMLSSDAVILATGGARGITAEVCLELAQRCQPVFILVGQSPLPDGLEPAETAGITERSDLKRRLMKQLQAGGARVSAADVERAYRRLEKEREVRRTLGALSATGARAHYVQLDVRDPDALGALIDDIYATYDRLDGVIHGAGVIEDKLVRDKTLESFERVLRTKTMGAFALARRLRLESLRFLVFFSSVAGRFGNRGQADYAAANEVVSKLALTMAGRWPGRICSIAWAPWDRRGMVSPALKEEFIRRGIALVSPEFGRRTFWEEIQHVPSTGAAEVVVGGWTSTSSASAAVPHHQSLPLLTHAIRSTDSTGAVQFTRALDVSIDRYLADHQLDGQPVLPLAVATELMAEAAQAAYPELAVVAVRSLRLLKGIVVGSVPVEVVVAVSPAARAGDGTTEAAVEISTPALAPRVRYRAVVQLGPSQPPPQPFAGADVTLAPFPLTVDRAYREWTFHGPMFQRVTQITGIGSRSMRGVVFSSPTVPVLAGVPNPDWIIDPFVFDAALQMLLMWSRAQNGLTALPTRFERLRRHGSLSRKPVTCHVDVESHAGGHALNSDVHFVDESGRVLAVLEGMEASCTAALNRLTGQGSAEAAHA